jgi:threonine/homoserine efflux transporter RhtA
MDGPLSAPVFERFRGQKDVPSHAWFVISAIFRYLGPSFAVLLFPAVGVLGVAWLRIPTGRDVMGIALVMVGLAVHKPAA